MTEECNNFVMEEAMNNLGDAFDYVVYDYNMDLDEFMDMFKNKKLMPHLHISLQSCDDDVLKRMRRKYGSSLIEDRLLKLKE